MATKEQLIASAQKNLEKGQINKAIKDYQELLKLEPKVDQHKQKLADLLCRANLKEEGLVLYDSLAKGYAERGFFAKAIAVYKQIQRIDPANTDAYLRLAELNRNLGLIGNAMSEYRSLLELYEKRNMAVDVAGVLQQMVELDPKNIKLQLRVLHSLLKGKFYEKAIETILKACEEGDKAGDTDKSENLLYAVLTFQHENNQFNVELATRLSAQGLLAEAIYVLKFLLKASPKDGSFLNELAMLYSKTDDKENEIFILGQLLTVQPSGEIAERLVRLCMAKGDYERAMREVATHESTLDDENHTLIRELYQELEPHLPGDQRVRSAIVRLFGGPSLTPTGAEAPSPFSSGDVVMGETSGDFSFNDDEFQLDELLSPLPRSHEAAVQPQDEIILEEEIVAEEFADVSIELPNEEISLEEIDSFVKTAELTLSPEIIQEDAGSLFIDINYDFTESGEKIEEVVEEELEEVEEVEEELEEELEEVEEEVEEIVEEGMQSSFDSTFAAVTESETVAENGRDQGETRDSFDLGRSAIALDSDSLPCEETPPLQVNVESVVEVASSAEDDDEILELESLEEEDDLGAEIAALEELLAAEMEETPSETHSNLNVAVDKVESVTPAAHEDFFDLAAELLDDGALQATEGLANVGEIDRFRFDSVFAEFKKGVDAQVDNEDTEAHYDLGIAYKEMGLMDDAIGEFKKSMRDPKRLADSLTLIGICHAEKGAFADAEIIFLASIARPEVLESDKVGMQYELGLVYEVWGRLADALRSFEAVAHSDPSFRNVGEKIDSLRLHTASGEGEATVDTPGSASPGKDRVSFV